MARNLNLVCMNTFELITKHLGEPFPLVKKSFEKQFHEEFEKIAKLLLSDIVAPEYVKIRGEEKFYAEYSFAFPDVVDKKRPDSQFLNDLIFRSIICFREFGHVDLQLLGINGKEFDPDIEKLGQGVNEALAKFFLIYRQYADDLLYELIYGENRFSLSKTDMSFINGLYIDKIEPSLDELMHMSQEGDIVVTQVQSRSLAGWKTSKGGNASALKFWTTKVEDDPAELILPVAGMVMTAQFAMWNKVVHVLKIIKVKYPPLVQEKIIQLNLPLSNPA